MSPMNLYSLRFVISPGFSCYHPVASSSVAQFGRELIGLRPGSPGFGFAVSIAASLGSYSPAGYSLDHKGF